MIRGRQGVEWIGGRQDLPCLRIKLDPSLVASDDGEWQRQTGARCIDKPGTGQALHHMCCHDCENAGEALRP